MLGVNFISKIWFVVLFLDEISKWGEIFSFSFILIMPDLEDFSNALSINVTKLD